jgi:hypothetical protein
VVQPLTITEFHRGIMGRIIFEDPGLNESLSMTTLSTIAYVFSSWKSFALEVLYFRFKRSNNTLKIGVLYLKNAFPDTTVHSWRELYRKICTKHIVDLNQVDIQNNQLLNAWDALDGNKGVHADELWPVFYLRCL